MVLYLALLIFVVSSNGLPYPQGCGYGGENHSDGGEVAVADPCVKCRCVRGSLVCRLRVCAPQPHPPPPGCLVLTRRAECCQRLLCNQDTAADFNRRRLSDEALDEQHIPTGCVVNGTVYAEGSAMDSSTRCQYCYCIKGRQHCVKPQCQLLETNCAPVYATDACCPVKYNCSQVANISTTTTSKPISGCEVDGRLYPEGSQIPREGVACENCFCLMGRLHCEPVVCSVPVNKNCVPVISTGHCCPTSYNCGIDEEGITTEEITKYDSTALNVPASVMVNMHVNSERSITGNTKNSIIREVLSPSTQPSFGDNESTSLGEETSTLETTTDEVTTLFESKEITELGTETAATTEVETTTTPTTTVVTTEFTDTGDRANAREEDQTTTSHAEEVTVMVNESSTNKTSAAINATVTNSELNKSLPSEIEAILNKTKLTNRDEDYDYDYSDPSLPPSLPNLRIIPFVAADAVVDDPQEPVYKMSIDKSHSTAAPHFYEGFSPPAETEGGFVPKEPLLDGPFYESKYNNMYHNSNPSADLMSVTLSSIPAITEPPKLIVEEKCVSGGRTYRHGELLTEPAACDICMCFYGKVVCQKPKCPAPDPGCHLVSEIEHGTCCRKHVCNGNSIESPTRVVDHLPPLTVADVIVTPDPFRDVIRTEPAPDLSSLIGEVIPFLWDQSTTTPVSLTTAEPMESGPVFNNDLPPHPTITSSSTFTTATIIKSTSNNPTPSGSKFSSTASSIITYPVTAPTNISIKIDEVANKNKVQTDYEDKDIKEEDTTDDEFSFGSVFSYFFDSDKWTTEKPVAKSPSPSQIKNYTSDTRDMNNTLSAKLNNSDASIDQSLQHRSDEDINELSNLQNSILDVTEKPGTTLATGEALQISKMPEGGSDRGGENVEQYTTVRSSLSKSNTKRYGNKSRPRPTTPSHLHSLSEPDPGAASGLLKLAGCNIYGRMYRVGRIISELSGPCLECMCTEVGVQCRPLKC